MERDFLGLGLKSSSASVKEEIDDNDNVRQEFGHNKGSASQWPFLNKISVLPHVAAVSAAREPKDNKIASDRPVSSGFLPFRAVDTSRNRVVMEVQKPITHHAEVNPHLAVASHPAPYSTCFANHINEAKMFHISNQANSVSGSNHSLRTYFTATMKQQLREDISVLVPHPVLPVNAFAAGAAEPWNCVKSAGPLAQLTIFYAGTVNVYNDISPEKAQAIMSLAGNESAMAYKMPQLAKACPVQAPICSHIKNNSIATINPNNESHLSSPLSVSSNTGTLQSASGSTSTGIDDPIVATSKLDVESNGNNLMVPTTETFSSSPPAAKLVDAPKVVDVMRAVRGTAIPQARKASLARFLEKRKERVMNVAPYNLSKKSAEQVCSGLSVEKQDIY